MKYWTRTTHNFNNETREWEFREELSDIKGASCLGVHALVSGRWMNLPEIIEENEKYYDQWKDESNLKKESISKETIVADLELFEAIGIVKSKG